MSVAKEGTIVCKIQGGQTLELVYCIGKAVVIKTAITEIQFRLQEDLILLLSSLRICQ